MAILLEDREMTFGEHLEELRRRVILALLGLAIGTALCGIFYKDLLVAMLKPYKVAYDSMIVAQEEPAEQPPPPPDVRVEKPADLPEGPARDAFNRMEQRLAALEARLNQVAPEAKKPDPPGPYSSKFPPPRLIQGSPMTVYITLILLCTICGIILSSPWIMYQIWAFVGVGLHPHEQRFVYIYGPVSFILFISGAVTFYFLMLPMGLKALMSPGMGVMVDGVSLIDPSLFLNDYFKFVSLMTLIFGIVFQTPLVVLFLAATGIVPLKTLYKQQRIVIMILVIAAAVFTPPDPVTMVMMGVPLILLYEIGLLAAWIFLRKRAKEGPEDTGGDWSGDEFDSKMNDADKPAPAVPAAEGQAPPVDEDQRQTESDYEKAIGVGEPPADAAEPGQPPQAEDQSDQPHGQSESWLDEELRRSSYEGPDASPPDAPADTPPAGDAAPQGEPSDTPPADTPGQTEPPQSDGPQPPWDEPEERMK